MTEPTGEQPQRKRRSPARPGTGAAKTTRSKTKRPKAPGPKAPGSDARRVAATPTPAPLPEVAPRVEDDPWAAILGPLAPAGNEAPPSADASARATVQSDPAAVDPVAQWERDAARQMGETSSPAQTTEAPPIEPAPTAPAPDSIRARFATAEELADWDEHAVFSPHGHVYQSLAWGEYRAAHGRRVWHIVFDDGFRLLVIGRDRPVVGGGWAYATRGPIPEEHAVLSATRAAAAAELLGEQGLDSLTVDGETPAEAGLGPALRARGFEPVEEVQTSRHRMDVRLGPEDAHNSDEQTIFASFGATTRNNIRQAERHGLRVKRLDAGGGQDGQGYGQSGSTQDMDFLGLEDQQRTERMLKAFYVMLDATAERRGFALASEDAFLDWSKRALAGGHMVYLQAEHDTDGPVAGAVFYRHGHRLTYSLAGDRAELRKAHPGAVRLLVWRGFQIALDERRSVVDLGGVDTEGRRGRPSKGDPTYGMYQFKESFGARWVDLTGAHQRTMRPMRHLAGRLIGRLASLRR